MTKTPCPYCYTAINETDTTCCSCGQAVNLTPPQAAHGCCECDDTNQEKDQTLEKILWAAIFAVIGGLLTAFAKGEL